MVQKILPNTPKQGIILIIKSQDNLESFLKTDFPSTSPLPLQNLRKLTEKQIHW